MGGHGRVAGRVKSAARLQDGQSSLPAAVLLKHLRQWCVRAWVGGSGWVFDWLSGWADGCRRATRAVPRAPHVAHTAGAGMQLAADQSIYSI